MTLAERQNLLLFDRTRVTRDRPPYRIALTTRRFFLGSAAAQQICNRDQIEPSLVGTGAPADGRTMSYARLTTNRPREPWLTASAEIVILHADGIKCPDAARR